MFEDGVERGVAGGWEFLGGEGEASETGQVFERGHIWLRRRPAPW